MTQVTIIGNLTEAPELRFTNSGKAVAGFTIAESSRVKGADGTWADGPSTFWRCSLWDSAAENMTESLVKGQRVIAVGEAKQRSFETKAGESRTVIEVTVSEVGPSLRWATAKVEKATGTAPRSNAKPRTPAPAVDDSDPWGSAPSFGAEETEPPF
jgi:single-strand DNA-binding protein